nr:MULTISPECIES: hypothetical protein [Delftia]
MREWIKRNESDEAVPGDSKNDRLFDTWQVSGAHARQIGPAAKTQG